MSMVCENAGLATRSRAMRSAAAAGTCYGIWAGLTHQHMGADVALRAAATQVVLSVSLTLLLALILERLFRLPSDPVRGCWLAALVTSALSIAWLFVGHTLMGTPRVLLAITPSSIVGTAFYCTYAVALLRHARRRRAADAEA